MAYAERCTLGQPRSRGLLPSPAGLSSSAMGTASFRHLVCRPGRTACPVYMAAQTPLLLVQAKERGELPDKRRLSQILSKYKDKVEQHTAGERESDALPSYHPAGDAVKEAFLREQERFTSRISLLASDCGITEEDWFQVGSLLLPWRARALVGSHR